MFSTIAIFIATIFAASAVASPGIKNSCNTGPIQCCGSLYVPNSAAATKAIGLLDVVIPNITGDIGAQCDPITVVGAGKGASCSSKPVCCEHNYYHQGVGLNCSPVTVL